MIKEFQRKLLHLWNTAVPQASALAFQGDSGLYRAFLWGMLLLAAFVILRGSWVCDDAFILMRVVDNWVDGLGLRWNVLERVQVSTSPLWVFVLAPFHAVTGEFFFTPIFVSLAVVCLGLWLTVYRILDATIWSVAFLSLFIFAKTLVDFSTSGLEVPLTFLCLVVFILALLRFETAAQKENLYCTILVFGAGAFAMLTRLDNACIVLPGLLFVFSKGPLSARRIGAALLGISPLILWEIFSLFYFGSFFPNTAYAKLNTGIPSSLYWEQGFYYLRTLMWYDPLSLFAIIIGGTIGIASWHRSNPAFWIAVGMVLHIVYVIRSGGDHMAGRFFAPDAFVALIILFYSKPASNALRGALTVLLLFVGVTAKAPPLFVEGDHFFRNLDAAGVVDLRAYFNNELAFMKMGRDHRLGDTPWAKGGLEARRKGKHAVVEPMIGCFGLYAGPMVHIIDPLALTDPLLARLPSFPKSWRVGHYFRAVPVGYTETVLGDNRISDPYLRKYYEHLKLVTRGALFDLERLITIWKMNTGAYDYLLDAYLRTMDRSFPYENAAVFRSPEGEPWSDPEHLAFSHKGLVVQTPVGTAQNKNERPSMFEISLRGGHTYHLEFWRYGKKTGELLLNMDDQNDQRMSVRNLSIPEQAVDTGFDRVFVKTERADQLASLGHIRFNPFTAELTDADVKPLPTPTDPNATPPAPVYEFGGKSLSIKLKDLSYSKVISLLVTGDNTFYFEIRKKGITVYSNVSAKTGEDLEMRPRDLEIPADIATRGYDELLLDPLAGRIPCALKHVDVKTVHDN